MSSEQTLHGKRIAILLPDLRGGGVERVRLTLAHEFIRIGNEVEFVLMRAQGELLNEARALCPITDLGVARARSLPMALARYLRRRRPDILLVAMWPLTVLAPFACWLSCRRCAVVVSEHNTLSIQYRDWGRLHRIGLRISMALGYRLAIGRVGVSKGVVEDIAHLSGLSVDAFEVIYNPLPEPLIPGAAAIARAEALWPVKPGKRILTVGSLKAQKNQALLLQAFARLEADDACMMLLGIGRQEAALRTLAADLGIADRVVFAGFRPNPTPFYRTADLFVLSSDYEGFGNVIVEALACGKPVVSTDCPSGPSEILDYGRYGLLVNVGDADGLSAAIADALQRPVDKEWLMRRAADFRPKFAAERYLKLIKADGYKR